MNTDSEISYLFAFWVIVHALLLSADFFSQLFDFFFQEYHQCQTVWIQIRPDIKSVLIWVQTVCKDYQQTTKVNTTKKT